MKLIDLTHTFKAGMPVYPGDPAPKFERVADLEKDGYIRHTLTTSLHAGTHIDAPWHFLKEGKKISDLPLEKFINRGVLIDAREKTSIDEGLLDDADIQPGNIVIVLTGWSKKFATPEYFENPPLVSPGFANKLVTLKAGMLGLDTPGPDEPPYKIHKILLSREILLIENLTSLEALLGTNNFEIIALPPKLKADGSPARVIARVDN